MEAGKHEMACVPEASGGAGRTGEVPSGEAAVPRGNGGAGEALDEAAFDAEIEAIKSGLQEKYGPDGKKYAGMVDQVHERFHERFHERRPVSRGDLESFRVLVQTQAELDQFARVTRGRNLSRQERERLASLRSELDLSMERMMQGSPAERALHTIYHEIAFKEDRQDGGIGHLPSPRRRRHNEEMMRTSPKDPFSYVFSGDYDLRQGQPASALAKAKQALSLDPDNAEAYSLRAAAYYELKRYPEAAADASAALRLNPGDPAARAVLKLAEGRGGSSGLYPAGSSLGASGGPGGMGPAASPKALAASADPRLAASASYARQAQRALGLRDYQAALDFAGRALELNALNAQAYNLRAIAYNRLRRYERALRDAEEGLRLDPRSGVLLASKAYALNKMRNFRAALAAADAALEINPNDAYAFRLRAEALSGLGDRDEMLGALRMAAGLDARYQGALEAALQLPEAGDASYLFADEELRPAARASRPGRGRRFGLLVLASLMGGVLFALGLLHVVFKPLADKARTLYRRLSSRSPAFSPAAAGSEQAPRLRGQYRILRQIGAGGMGLVFEGTDLSLERRVAIKEMRSELRQDRRERERFIREAKLVAALHHPNIVDIYAILEEGEELCLVFEFVSGRTVHEILGRQGPMGLREAAGIFRGMCLALDFAHGRGVIHRDLKPSNVMVTQEGLTKVMDFGIARVAKDAASRCSVTNTVVGTPPYMAPEQEQGLVRRESDIYSLGVCLYEMLSGSLPFGGTGAGMLMNKFNKSYVPVSRLVPGLPPAIDEVLAGALEPEPEKRLRGAGEFLARLEALAAARGKA